MTALRIKVEVVCIVPVIRSSGGADVDAPLGRE